MKPPKGMTETLNVMDPLYEKEEVILEDADMMTRGICRKVLGREPTNEEVARMSNVLNYLYHTGRVKKKGDEHRRKWALTKKGKEFYEYKMNQG